MPAVRPHTFGVLENLDARGPSNHLLIITRHQMKPGDIDRLNALRHLKVTLLFTYSGIDDRWIEPYPSSVAADSLRLTSAPAQRRYRTILYWRPLVPGLNDSCEHLDRAYALARHADATVFTGLFYRDEIAAYYRASGLPEPYGETARRKIVPETLERRVLTAFDASTPLFRKTSCAVSFAHGLPDYNGHAGIAENCDICPVAQLDLCRQAHRISPGFLLGTAILVEIPISMVLFSRLLKYRANRWANIAAGAIMTVVQFVTLFVGSGQAMYYTFFSIIEIVCTLFIVWYAWRWQDVEVSRPAHTVRVSPWASARRCHDRHSVGHSPSVGRRSDPSACKARPGCLAVFLAWYSRLIFSMDDPRCVNGRSHGCHVCTFDRVSKCVTPGLLLTEPEHTSSSSSPILTRSQAWPETPSGDSTPSTTVAGNVQRKANTGLASIPSWS